MECIATLHQLNVGRSVGPQAAQARPGWEMLINARALAPWAILSISGNDDMTSPQQTMIVMLIPVYDILISSQSRCSSAQIGMYLPQIHRHWITD